MLPRLSRQAVDRAGENHTPYISLPGVVPDSLPVPMKCPGPRAPSCCLSLLPPSAGLGMCVSRGVVVWP